jgi:hypothetical protein
MKKVFCRLLPALCLAALPAATVNAESSIDSTSILRIQQDSGAGVPRKTLAPLTQFLGVDVDKLGDGNLSAHLYGWGQVNLADRTPDVNGSDNRVEGSLTYGYLQYRFNNANARVRAGRLFVNEGIINEQVDGVSARTDLPYGFGISGFGGATVHTVHVPDAFSDGKGDGIFGGRVNYRKAGLLEIGLSGVYESKAPARTSLPFGVLPGSYGNHRVVGGDLWFSPVSMLQVSGHTSYNTETEKIAEHSYLLQVTPVKDLVLSANFDEQHDRDYFYSSIIFADMIKDLGQESRSFGGSASYKVLKNGEISADYKHYSRDIGKAERFGGELRGTFLDNSLRSGLSYHYLRAGSDFAITPIFQASGSFQEFRCFLMRDTKSYFASLDAIDYLFKKPVNGKDNAWEASGSLGYHLAPELALSGDLSYGENPQYDNEFKGLIRLTYNMTSGKGATK